MVLPADSQSRTNRLTERLDKLRATSFRGDEDDDDELDRRHQSSEKRLLKVLRDACAFVRGEIAINSPHLPEVVENVQILLDKGVEYAYGDSQLFDYLPSWAHDNTGGQPMVLDTTEGRLPFPVGLFANFLQGLGLEDRSKGQLPPGPWKDTSWRHPKASRLARFRPRKFDLTSLEGHPLAKVIYDARCEIQSTSVPIPIDMYLSQGNTCLAVFGATGYKQRAPYLEYYLLEGSEASQDFQESYSVEPGFAEVAVHAALDESRRLIFLGDSRRVKSFAWAAPNGEAYEEPHPTHTLASNRVHGPLAVLPNGTVLRAGKGEVAVWNIDSLKTHGESGEQIIGKEDESIRENTWRDDPEEIEASSGSSPDSYIRFAGHPDWEIGRWKPLIQTPSTMLCQINRYACGTIDMEHGGSIVARYLGHGGTLTDFAFSGGDPQVFATTCSDGFARLFDIRTPLPVLTFDACQNIDSCDAVALAHPNGIPTLFSGTCKAHQIKVWDIRARTPVYELATGNNQVQALAWDPTRNHLFAATECGYLDRMGNHHEYRYVRKEAGRAPGDDSDNEDDEYLEGEQAWPENAWHTENYFSYMFDAGDHRIYRYAFKEDPDVSILPGYGDATPGGFDSYW